MREWLSDACLAIAGFFDSLSFLIENPLDPDEWF